MTTASPRPSATQALVDLVVNPEELGYRAAADRHGGVPRRRWWDGPAIVAGCVVIGFLLAVAWSRTHRSAPATAQAHAELVQRVRDAEQQVAGLDARATRIDAALNGLRTAALSDTAPVLQRLRRAQVAAGLVAVTGPGVQVTLSEPAAAPTPSDVPGPGTRTPSSGGHILTDRDLRSVVNQLWSDGAEAIAVNGIRLTPTSAIRFAGDAVLVDLLPIDSPYTVDAIGPAARLDTGFASSDVASRYQTLAGARGIGFGFSEQGSLQLPADPGTSLRFARPGAGPAASTGPGAPSTPGASSTPAASPGEPPR